MSRVRQISLSCRLFSVIISPNSNTYTVFKRRKKPESRFPVSSSSKTLATSPRSAKLCLLLPSIISNASPSLSLSISSKNPIILMPLTNFLRILSLVRSSIYHAIVLYGQANMIDHTIHTFKQCNELGIPRFVRIFNSLIVACILDKKL